VKERNEYEKERLYYFQVMVQVMMWMMTEQMYEKGVVE
jgi:hypothetical protein